MKSTHQKRSRGCLVAAACTVVYLSACASHGPSRSNLNDADAIPETAFYTAISGDSPAVVITPVRTNRRFELSAIPEDEVARLDDQRQVKVTGTYFPKGVYAEPDASSRVLMRIAPGTLLQVKRQYRNWYQVMTSDGPGYLRLSDGSVQRSGAADVS